MAKDLEKRLNDIEKEYPDYCKKVRIRDFIFIQQSIPKVAVFKKPRNIDMPYEIRKRISVAVSHPPYLK